MIKFSEISQSAVIKSMEGLQHPVHISPDVVIHAECVIGGYSFLNSNTVIYPHVTIGRYCSVAKYNEIGVANHPVNFLSTHTFQYHNSYFPKIDNFSVVKKVSWRSHPETIIGNDVWIGAKCIIKSGVSIGNGAIVGAGSVVVGNVAPYEIVGGVPAKHIRWRFPDEVVKRLLNIEWWQYDILELGGIDFSSIDQALADLEAKFGK